MTGHPMTPATLSRRTFLQAGAGVGGGLLIGLHFPLSGRAEAAGDGFTPNAFVRIGPDGVVVLTMPYVEMGQGTYTAIPMLIAEELEVELDAVRLEHAPPDEAHYANPLLGIQATGNSNAIRGGWEPLRRAGATARTMLIAAAAERWDVDPETCHAEHGTVVHAASGRHLAYGALADDAARRPVPDDVALKPPAEFRLIGTPAKRLDIAGKVDGSALYGIDVRPPGLMVATLLQSPVRGGTVKSLDATATLAVKGVRQVVRLADAVAVVADHMGAAKKGLAALAIEWDDGPNGAVSGEAIRAELEAATERPGAVAESVGDAASAAGVVTTVDAVYSVPFLAHATMEPMNCTAHVQADGCEIWVGTQAPTRARDAAAEVTGLPPEAVIVHNHFIGGGFGRRLDVDGVRRAVEVARHVDGPVKLVWTREEDVRQDMYRPMFLDRLSAGLGADGRPITWTNRFAGSSVVARFLPLAFADGLDPDVTEGAIDLVYDLPNLHVEYVRVEPSGVPTAFWRSVGPSHNVFVTECFMDELAAAAEVDPVAYRLALLGKSPRAKAALERAAEKAGWGTPLAAGSGRGVAVQNVFGSFLAIVAEVAATESAIRVTRVVAAIDCGIVVNPDTVRAQIESGVIFGISAALFGKVTVKDGRVAESNFHDYRVLRLSEAPAVEVHIVESAEHPGGIGETGTSAIMPAVANAIFAATGQRLRTLPVSLALSRRSG